MAPVNASGQFLQFTYVGLRCWQYLSVLCLTHIYAPVSAIRSLEVMPVFLNSCDIFSFSSAGILTLHVVSVIIYERRRLYFEEDGERCALPLLSNSGFPAFGITTFMHHMRLRLVNQDLLTEPRFFKRWVVNKLSVPFFVVCIIQPQNVTSSPQ